jgi:cytochrome c553
LHSLYHNGLDWRQHPRRNTQHIEIYRDYQDQVGSYRGRAARPERGEALGYTCLGCHGIEGYRNAYPSYRVPKLGGQKAAYLAIALRGYRDGSRVHPTMTAQASSLSDQEIDDISAYLASIGGDTVAAGGTKGAALDEAATCSACHGQNGIAMSPTWPTLAGQHEDYLVNALTQYRDGTRTSAVMAPMATSLSDADIRLLARYFSRLAGLETTVAE